MNTTLRITNWVAIAFFTVSVLAEPKSSGWLLGAANILPFGAALIAVRPDSQRVALWTAAGLNALWALLYLVIALIVLVGWGGLLVAVPLALAVAVPCAFNARMAWLKLRERA